MSNLFSDEKVNTGRQVELDIAKALSIVFMIFLHVLMVVKGFNYSLSPAYDFVVSNVLGRPCAAPVFMFCMGVGIVYSRHSQWNAMIRRGIILYLTGIVVNVFEFILPGLIHGALVGRWDVFPMANGMLLFCVDILAFAGLAFVTMGILKKFEVSDKWMVVIAVVMSLIGTFTRGIDFGIPVLNLFFADFIGSGGGFGAFPLFNWFIFPVAGVIWGQYFIRVTDKRRFFRFWPIYIIVAFVFFYVTSFVVFESGIFTEDVHFYYFLTTLDAIFCIIYAHGIIGFCFWAIRFIPEKIIKLFSILSSNINNIYIAQWFFIPLTIIFISYFFKNVVYTDLLTFIIAICILIISTVVAVDYKKLKAL